MRKFIVFLLIKLIINIQTKEQLIVIQIYIKTPIKDSAKNILEIGIGDFGTKNGGSLLLWKSFFTNATIYGVDILPKSRVLDELIDDKSIQLYCETNAYDYNFIKKIRC